MHKSNQAHFVGVAATELDCISINWVFMSTSTASGFEIPLKSLSWACMQVTGSKPHHACMYACCFCKAVRISTCYMFRWPGSVLFRSLPCVLVWLQFVLTFAYMHNCTPKCSFHCKYPAFIKLAPSILRPRVSKNCGKTWYGLAVWDKVGNITFSGGPLLLSRHSDSHAFKNACAPTDTHILMHGNDACKLFQVWKHWQLCVYIFTSIFISCKHYL